MGKVSNASSPSEMKRKKKTSLPTENSSTKSALNFNSVSVTGRRSTRRNPKNLDSTPNPEFDNDDGDERTKKKVKLIGRLPRFEEAKEFNGKKKKKQKTVHSRDYDSGSEFSEESDERESNAKKHRIKASDPGSGEAVLSKVEDAEKATDALLQEGSPLKESGPTIPLPDKKLLVFILDRLQKKDTHGVFSEPVDIDELPDYFEVVKHPMDFGTIRKKLDSGAYMNLEQLEVDVYLICSNAMLYNASDTVFYRQARAIQELARRDFENLKQEGDDGEPLPKVVRRGRPPSKKTPNKSVETSLVDRILPQGGVSSDAAAPADDNKTAALVSSSSGYNLRKAPALNNRFRSSDDFVSLYNRQRNGGGESTNSDDWNREFPASILRADMKHGKKQLMNVDETKRNTYTEFFRHSTHRPFLFPVGFQEPLAYARSLSTFSANLGPVARIKASKRIESSLPEGLTSPSGSDHGLRFDGFMKNRTPLMNFEASSPRRTPFPMLHQYGNGVTVNLTSPESRNGVVNHPMTTTMMMMKQMEGVSDSKCPSGFPGSELRICSSSSSPQQPDLALQL